MTLHYHSSLANDVDYDFFDYFSRNEDMAFGLNDELGRKKVSSINRIQFAAKSHEFAFLANDEEKEAKLLFEELSFPALVVPVVSLKFGKAPTEYLGQLNTFMPLDLQMGLQEQLTTINDLPESKKLRQTFAKGATSTPKDSYW